MNKEKYVKSRCIKKLLIMNIIVGIYSSGTVFGFQSFAVWKRDSRQKLKFPTQFQPLLAVEMSIGTSGTEIDGLDTHEVKQVSDNDNENLNMMPNEEHLSENMIAVSAAIKLPFPADLAFDAFSDLPRQPSWSSWLQSVSYIDDDSSSLTYSECGVPLRDTKWVMGWKKLKYSWNSRVIRVERPNVIEWESTSGLRNMGTIHFVEEKEVDKGGGKTDVTKMILSFKFVTPTLIARIFRRSNKIAASMKTRILVPTLLNFRRIIMEEDLGMDPESIQSKLMALEGEGEKIYRTT